METASLYRTDIVPIIETREVPLEHVELSDADRAVIGRINTNDERFKTLVRGFEQQFERGTYLIVEPKNGRDKYPLVLSPRRYLVIQALGKTRTRIAVVSSEAAESLRQAVRDIKNAIAGNVHFVKIGEMITEILERWQIRRDELCDMLDINIVVMSRLTSYQCKSSPLERAFIDEGFVESPNNYERLRSLPVPAQEELLKYARVVKRPITRTEIDKAREWYLQNKTAIEQQQQKKPFEPTFRPIPTAAPKPKPTPTPPPRREQPQPAARSQQTAQRFMAGIANDIDLDALENELDRAFSQSKPERRQAEPAPRTTERPLFASPEPEPQGQPVHGFSEIEMRLFLAARGMDWRVPENELNDAFAAAVIRVAESAPDDLKRKIRRDRVLEDAERAAMEGRVDPKIILEMIRLMRESA